MQKLFLGILVLVQMLFATSANACISINPMADTVKGTVAFCLFWLFAFMIGYGVRGLICLISKDLNQQKRKFKYLLPAWSYAGAIGVMIGIIFLQPDLCYAGYMLYVIFCCGYQFWKHLKRQQPKSWAWVCPIVPFYAYPVGSTIKNFTDIDSAILVIGLFIGFNAAVAYGLYKLETLKTAKYEIIKKIVWGMLLLGCLVYGIYVLYTYYTYVSHSGELQNLKGSDCI